LDEKVRYLTESRTCDEEDEELATQWDVSPLCPQDDGFRSEKLEYLSSANGRKSQRTSGRRADIDQARLQSLWGQYEV
jgi:hypothetical protein